MFIFQSKKVFICKNVRSTCVCIQIHNNCLFTIYRDIKGEQKTPENFLFCFDFTINSKYVILFHFESANIWEKIREKKSGSFYCIKWFTSPPEGLKVTLPPEGHKVTLPPSYKREQEISGVYILCKILWPGGVGKKWCRGKKWKMSQWGTKWKEEKRGKEKEEKDVAEIGAPHHKKTRLVSLHTWAKP